MTENKRLKFLMKELEFKTQKDFAAKLNVKQGSLSDIFREKPGVGVSNSIADKLEFLYQINKKWLKTGEGAIFLTDDQIINKSQINAKPLHEVQYPIDATESPFLEMGNGLLTMFIPKVDEYAYGSFPGGFRDPEWVETLPKVAITVNKRHSGRYFAFDILGDSMENYETKEDAKKSIAEGSTVVGREIDRFHWKSRLHYHRWNAFIFVHKEYGVACKTILDQEVEDGVIHLGSFNPDKKRHKNFTWHLDDISAIYNVVRIINEP